MATERSENPARLGGISSAFSAYSQRLRGELFSLKMIENRLVKNKFLHKKQETERLLS